MKRALGLLIVLPVVTAFAQTSLQKEGDSAAFLKQLESQWSEYEKQVEAKMAGGWNVQVHTDRLFVREGKTTETKITDLFLNDGKGGVALEYGGFAQCGNDLYSFWLRNDSPEGASDKKWILKSAELSKKESHQYKGFRTGGMNLYDFSKSHTVYRSFYATPGKHLRFVLNRPYCEIKKVEQTREGGDDLTLVEFLSPHQPTQELPDGVQSGTFKFHRSAFSLPESYSLEILDGAGNRMKISGRFHYSAGALPLPIRQEADNFSVGGSNPWTDQVENRIEYLPPLDSTNAQRFSLSHYGLPEPQGVVWSKPSSPSYFCVGLVFGLLALSFLGFLFVGKKPSSRVSALN